MRADGDAGDCRCGEAPERANDFYWENERVGFRAYGPGDEHNWSGIDVFSKLPNAAISCGELLQIHDFAGNWHITPHKGILDDYAVGSGRGVGGVAFRRNGEWLADYGNWVAYRIIENSRERCAFELDYKLPFGGTMTLGIALEKGSSLFRETVSLSKDVPTQGLEVGVGLDLNPAREHAGDVAVDAERFIVSLFEAPHAREGAEASRMSAIYAIPGENAALAIADEPNGAKMIITKPLGADDAGRTVLAVFAGADGTECGRFATAGAWHGYVRDHFDKSKEKNK